MLTFPSNIGLGYLFTFKGFDIAFIPVLSICLYISRVFNYLHTIFQLWLSLEREWTLYRVYSVSIYQKRQTHSIYSQYENEIRMLCERLFCANVDV